MEQLLAGGCLVSRDRTADKQGSGGCPASRSEEGTGAHQYADDVAQETKQQRRERLMTVQQGIARAKLRQQVGNTVEVLVEGTHPDTDLLLVGRMATQAIEVDGQVLINDGSARPGVFVDVEVTEVAGYDLVGGIVGSSAALATASD